MCRTTWYHNDVVITNFPTPHPTIIISGASHPHPTSHEVPMPHVSRPDLWWRIQKNFDATHVCLIKGDLQLISTRYYTSGLYYIYFDAPTPTHHIMNPTELTLSPLAATREAMDYSSHHMTTKSYLVQYLHRVACSTVPSTWITDIERGCYASWSSFTTELVRYVLPKIIHTDKGHLRQEQKNLRSTKQIINPSVIPSVIMAPKPIPEDVGVWANMVFIKILSISGNISSENTERSPVTSIRGDK